MYKKLIFLNWIWKFSQIDCIFGSRYMPELHVEVCGKEQVREIVKKKGRTYPAIQIW